MIWYIIIGMAALAIGLTFGLWIGKRFLKPLPSYDEEVEKRAAALEERMKQLEHDCEAEFAQRRADMQLKCDNDLSAMLSRHKEHLAAVEEQNSAAIKRCEEQLESRIALIKSQEGTKTIEIRHEYESKIEQLKHTIELLQSSIETEKRSYEEWRAGMINEKRSLLGIRKMEREAELVRLEHEYEERKKNVMDAIDLIERTLNLWSNAERLAYEEREGRKSAEERNKLALSERSINELKELYYACSHLSLSNPLPLYKAIYEIYLRGPVKDLTVRIVGSTTVTGIYKIWNVENGKVYVGQSVDIAERWKQHIKRGVKCEAGTLTGASLYSAMWDEGIWNFRFEVLEECEKASLNEREKFWISYYQSNEIGYNQKL